MKKPCLIVLLSTALATTTHAAPVLTPPVDEADKDAALVAFRDGLRAAAEARDTDAVLAASCPEILISFGGDGGLDEFRAFLSVPEDTLSEEYKPQAQAMRDAKMGGDA